MLIRPDTRRMNWKAAYLLIAFAVTFWAAYSLRNDDYPLISLTLVIFTIGGVLFVLGSSPPTAWLDLPARENMSRWQKWVIAAAVIFSILSFIAFWFRRGIVGQFTGFPLFLWLLSIPLFWVGSRGFCRTSTEGNNNSKVEIILLVLVLAGAFFLRTYHIDVFPNGCQTDECNNGLDALDWLRGKPYVPFARTNEGQATLFTYLLALSFKVFGVGVLQMRMTSVFIGTFTIIAFYFLARDWLEWRFALAATALFAASRWHLTFSRIVYELILAPFAEILFFLFFLRALKNGRNRDWAFAGLCLAFGMNTYTAFRVIPILVVIYLAYWIATHRHRIWRDMEGIVYLFLGAWLGMIPLSVYVLQNWDTFMERTSHISIFNDISNAGGSLQPLWINIKKTLWSFHLLGDGAALNNLPWEPMLDIVVGVLVIFGLAYALRYVGKPLGFLYIIWVIGGLSLAILSTVAEAPTARRPIGLLPVIFLMSGMVLQLAAETFRSLASPIYSKSPQLQGLMAHGGNLLLVLIVLASGTQNVNAFFTVQAKNQSVWNAYSSTEAMIGNYIRELPRETQVYLEPYFDPHSAIVFISQFRPYTALDLARHVPILDAPVPPRPVVYVLNVSSNELESPLHWVYPQGVWNAHSDPFGEVLFYTFELSAKDVEKTNSIKGEYYDGDRILEKPIQDAGLQFLSDETGVLPLPSPFTAKWSGSVYFPDGHGIYSFSMSADGNAELLVDDKSILKTSAGTGMQTVSSSQFFVGGFHTFTLIYQGDSDPRELALLWKGPKSDFAPIPHSAYFNAELARNGLIGYYYPSGDPTALPPSLIQHDLFVFPNKLLVEPFSIIWMGKIEIPETGEYIFSTYSDDGSYVYIDHQLIVDNGGSHGGEEREGSVTLSQGLYDLEIHYWQLGGTSEMQFWWIPPNKPRSIVPLEYLFPEDIQSEKIP